jgi:hypothetical protein
MPPQEDAPVVPETAASGETAPGRRVPSRPLRVSAPRRHDWGRLFAWPALRWAAGVAILGIIVVEAGVLVRQSIQPRHDRAFAMKSELKDETASEKNKTSERYEIAKALPSDSKAEAEKPESRRAATELKALRAGSSANNQPAAGARATLADTLERGATDRLVTNGFSDNGENNAGANRDIPGLAGGRGGRGARGAARRRARQHRHQLNLEHPAGERSPRRCSKRLGDITDPHAGDRTL